MDQDQPQPPRPKPEEGSTRLQLLSGMRVSIIEGMLALALTAFTTGSVMTGFALSLGATSIQIGIISGILPLANLLQIISPLWVERLKSRKTYVALTSGFHRLLLCLSVLTIFLPPQIRVYAFLGLLTISFISAAMSTVAWGTWMSDMVPEDIRGRYFAKRNAYIYLTIIVLAPVAGKILDLYPHSTGWGLDNVKGSTGFLIIFALGLVCAICNTVSLFFQYEPPFHPTRQNPEKLFRTYILAFRNSPFISIVFFYTVWTFARTIADPFYSVYMIQNLKISYFQIKMYETSFFIVLIISSFGWGYIADKFGNKPIARICSALFTLSPLLWIFDYPGHIGLLWFQYIFVGILSGGMNLASFNLFLGSSPRKNKSVYLSLWSAITGIVGFIGPIVGGWLIKLLPNYNLPLGDLRLCNLQILFCLSALLTLVSCLIFPNIKESKKPITVSVYQMFRLLNPFLLIGLIYNLVLFNVTKEEKSKLRASRALGKLKSPLAVEELIEALNDSSPAVREQAAVSLGEIGDSQAADVLITKLESPEENIQEEAAMALGKMHHPKAVDPLLRRLGDPDSSIKMSVIEALGAIPDERAREALFDRLQKETDPKIFPTLVKVLSDKQDPRIVPIALKRLDSLVHPSSENKY